MPTMLDVHRIAVASAGGPHPGTRHGSNARRAVMALLQVFALSLLLAASVVAADTTGRVDLPRFPAISPDGSEIVFSWGGDLWRASSTGGAATRLTSHPLDDLHASWSPDGEALVFTSLRDGYLNLWRIRRDGTGIEQLTHADRFLRNPAWTRDADGREVITFSAHLEGDVYREQRPYAIPPTGGQHERLFEAFGSTPRVSPDGSRVAFTRGGYYHDWSRRDYRGPDAMDVWLHDRDGNAFTPVTERDGDDGDARWAGNDQLIFLSDRDQDTVNLFRIDADAREAEPQRLTNFRGHDIQHFDVADDGRTAVIQVWDQLYTLDLHADSAEPRPLDLRAGEDGRSDQELLRVDREVSEAALSPDGKVMAFIAHGRVYVRHVDEHSATHAVTRGTHARHRDLAWSPDGLRLYFTSDADGSESIYQARVALTRAEIRQAWEQDRRPADTSATDEPGADGSIPAHDDAGTTTPTEEDTDQSPSAEPTDPFGPIEPMPPVDPTDPSVQPDPTQPSPPDDPVAEPASEPETVDEDELDPDAAEPAAAPELDPARWHDAVRFSVQPVVATENNDREARPSPDGGALAFRRGRGDLVIRDLATGEDRPLVEGWDSNLHWRWSPDSRHIAYAQNNLDFSANIFVVPTDGSADPVNITRHPRNDLQPRWSADGRKLSFISNRSGESYDLYRVYLDRSLENQTARERTRYYRNAREAAGKRTPLAPQIPENPWSPTSPAEQKARQLDLDEAWRRVERVTATPGHQTSNEMTPGGDRYVFNAQGEGLMVMNWDGSERRRLGSAVNLQHLNLAGDRAVYVADGRAGIVELANAKHERIDISDRIRIDRREQSLQKFHEAARIIEENFYLPDLKGLDWDAIVADYAELIGRARTATEFSDLANRFMGELAASHMGVSSPGQATAMREPSGRLGIDVEHVELDNGRYGYRVQHVLPEGPADRLPMRLLRGDVITEIDGQPFADGDTLLQRLRGRVDEEVIVAFERRVGERRREFQALITPVNFDALSRLRYDDFRRQARRKVEALSDGRLGYIHIQSMNQASLEQFQGELYAAAHDRDGLVIDVRNNGGGHTTDRILTSIMASEHAYTIPAGADPSQRGHYPQDRLDAPRYTQPMNMLVNEKSHSNAEILAHAFRTLERGNLVGAQTYGGVISTGSHRLIDGTIVRRPFRGWYLPDGTDMEHHGARPHLPVEQTPADEVAGRDRQLEHAVEDLLQRIDDQD